MKSIVLLCEDRAIDAWIRQDNINRLYGCSFGDLAPNMLIVPRRSEPRNRLMMFDRNGNGHLTTFFFQFLERAKDFGAQFTVLDTKSDLFLGNQNDEDQARTFVRQCTDRIAEETGGAVMLIYHPSRAGIRDGTGESGSVQWDAAFRSRLLLERQKSDAAQPAADPYARVLTRKKSNFALRDETIEMRWEEGIFLRTDTLSQTGVIATARGITAKRVFLELLDDFTKAGRRVSDAKNGKYAPREFVRHPNRQGVKLNEFVTAMNDLFAERKIAMTGNARGRWIVASQKVAQT